MATEQYDHLWDTTGPEVPPSVADAAVHLGHTMVEHAAAEVSPSQTSQREGYWTPPTQAQIDRAAQYGFDLAQQAKYYPDKR